MSGDSPPLTVPSASPRAPPPPPRHCPLGPGRSEGGGNEQAQPRCPRRGRRASPRPAPILPSGAPVGGPGLRRPECFLEEAVCSQELGPDAGRTAGGAGGGHTRGSLSPGEEMIWPPLGLLSALPALPPSSDATLPRPPPSAALTDQPHHTTPQPPPGPPGPLLAPPQPRTCCQGPLTAAGQPLGWVGLGFWGVPGLPRPPAGRHPLFWRQGRPPLLLEPGLVLPPPDQRCTPSTPPLPWGPVAAPSHTLPADPTGGQPHRHRPWCSCSPRPESARSTRGRRSRRRWRPASQL